MPTQRIFNDDDVRRMRYLFEERNLLLKEIAEIMNCSCSSVRKYLLEAGVEVERGNSWRRKTAEEDQADVIDFLYWGLGMSTYEIADSFGLSQKTIHRRMYLHGIPRRSFRAARALKEKKYPYTDEQRKARSEQMKEQWRTGNLKITRQTLQNLTHVNPDDHIQEAA